MIKDKNYYYARTFQFIENIKKLETYDEICSAVIAELEFYGLEYLTSLKIPGPGEDSADTMIFNNRPMEYVQRYADEGLVFKDPVVTELKFTTDCYSWGDVLNRRDLSKEERSIVYEASEFKANDGLIIPIVNRRGISSLFCPCGDTPDFSSEVRAALEIIGMASQQALEKALSAERLTDQPHQSLTSREREIMHWVATGKTDDEISDILAISRTTVSSHVENSKKKLNAYKRTFAVVQAIRFGEIFI